MDNLNKLFPKAEKVFQDQPIKDEIKNEVSHPTMEKVIEQLNVGITPSELQFFTGGKNKKFENKVNFLVIDQNGRQFLEYLQSDECSEIFKRNKITIYIETGNLFFNNVNTNESIYDFFF